MDQPNDISIDICLRLGIKSISQLGKTNRNWFQITTSNDLWKRLVKQDFRRQKPGLFQGWVQVYKEHLKPVLVCFCYEEVSNYKYLDCILDEIKSSISCEIIVLKKLTLEDKRRFHVIWYYPQFSLISGTAWWNDEVLHSEISSGFTDYNFISLGLNKQVSLEKVLKWYEKNKMFGVNVTLDV